MKSLEWKLNRIYEKQTPKTFLKQINNLSGGSTQQMKGANPWIGDSLLYILLLGLVIICVYILIRTPNQ